jgi:hypothetical protein
MRGYLTIAQTLLIAALLSGQVEGTVRLERAARIKRLSEEIWSRTAEDGDRVTKAYAAAHLSEIRQIIREQVVETLQTSEDPEVVRQAVRAILPTEPWANGGLVFVNSSALQGVKTFVLGYDWEYGGLGIPNKKVMIDGYRKAGLSYELAAETGDALNGCTLELIQLDSPRLNEMWLLAHAKVRGASAIVEYMRIYSFDGYQFKELWAPPWEPRKEPTFKITKDAVTISYCPYIMECRPFYQDAILLTNGGLVVSTAEFPGPNQR